MDAAGEGPPGDTWGARVGGGNGQWAEEGSSWREGRTRWLQAGCAPEGPPSRALAPVLLGEEFWNLFLSLFFSPQNKTHLRPSRQNAAGTGSSCGRVGADQSGCSPQNTGSGVSYQLPGRSDKAPQWGALTNSVSLSFCGQSPRPALGEPPSRRPQLRGCQASLTAACPCSLCLCGHMATSSVYFIRNLSWDLGPTLTQGDLILIASGRPCIQIRSPPRGPGWTRIHPGRGISLSGASVSGQLTLLYVVTVEPSRLPAATCWTLGDRRTERRGGRNRDGGRMDSGA